MLYGPFRGIELPFNTGFVPSRTRKCDIWTCFVVWDPLLMCTQLLAPASQKIVCRPQVSSIAFSSIISSYFFTSHFVSLLQFEHHFSFLIHFHTSFHFVLTYFISSIDFIYLICFYFLTFFNFHTYHTGNIHTI